MTNKDKLISYFQNFSNKDIQSLSEMFSESVSLVDWNINVVGKNNVIAANQEIFNSVDTIEVNPIHFYFDGENSFAVEIQITINKTEFLEVVDVIFFDYMGLIQSIKAYKK